MTALAVDCLDGGGHLIRGDTALTEDEARAALAKHYAVQAKTAPEYETDDCFILDDGEAEAAAARETCHIGLYRKIPCVCGDGHQWDMRPADRPGPGAFTGAYLSTPGVW